MLREFVNDDTSSQRYFPGYVECLTDARQEGMEGKPHFIGRDGKIFAGDSAVQDPIPDDSAPVLKIIPVLTKKMEKQN